MNVGYLVQGLRNNTLIAGKTTAFRINMEFPWRASSVATVQGVIVRPNGSTANLTWPAGQFVTVDVDTPIEGIVVLIPGQKMPDVGFYYLNANLVKGDGAIIGHCLLDGVELLPTKDLRMMVSRIWSATGPAPKPGEIEAAFDAMKRLATLYPIRDGISTLDGDRSAGLRYNFDNNPEGPPNQDGNLQPSWDSFRNPPPGEDSLDTALVYRFPDVGEDAGARTHPPYNGWLPYSGIVWQAPLGQPFCHETGHNHGCESPNSPNFDPTGQAAHSKYLHINLTDAEEGFDIQFNQPYPNPVFDVMFPTGPSPGYLPNEISMNSWDWEFIRKQILTTNSTGPHGPEISFQSLGGHDLRPYPSVIQNQDGCLQVFVIGGDTELHHISEKKPGGVWGPWTSLGGNNLQGPIITAANASGALEVFVVGINGEIYSIMQDGPNGHWGEFFRIGGHHVKAYAVSRNLDGRLEMVAVFGDGKLHDSWQLEAGGKWSDWAPLGGHDLGGPVSLVGNADGRLEAFAIGGDGLVYHRWQIKPNGWDGWSDWVNLIQPNLGEASDLRAVLAGEGRLVVILMMADGSISYLSQVVQNGDWNGAVTLFGHDLQWPCGVGRANDGRLEVAVVGGDGKVYQRWQVDPFRLGLWVDWMSFGGNDVKPGIAVEVNHAGQLEMFFIGADGALYRGLRPLS